MSSINESYSKVNIILDKPSDWTQWFFVVQDTAENNEIWEYIDPSKEKDELPALQAPKKPTLADISTEATSIAQLKGEQLTAYNLLYNEYKDELREFQKRKKAIVDLGTYIVRTTSTANIPLIDDLRSTHERLRALQKALAPSDSTRRNEVLAKYTKLKTFDKKQNLDNWLTSWRNVYKLAEKLELPDVQGFRPHSDLVRAIKPVYPGYADSLGRDLIRGERNKENAPSIIDLIEEFREHCRSHYISSTADVNNSAFATLQNNSPVSTTKTCLCGVEHLFKECPYLIESLRPPGWVPDEKIQQQIDEKLIRYERLAVAVEKAQKEVS